MRERRQNRIGGEPAQRTERARFHRVAQVGDQRQARGVARRHAVQRLDPAHRADPAGRAFAAAFDGAEFHREPGHFQHVGAVIGDGQTGMADQAVLGREVFIGEGRVEQRGREPRAQRTADLHRLDRTARGRAAGDVLDDLAQREAEGRLEQAAVFHVAGDLQRHRPVRTTHAVILIERRAAIHDHRHRGQRDHVVDDRGLAHEAFERRKRRLRAHHGALAFHRVQKARLLAADIGARAHADFHVEAVIRSHDARAKDAFATRNLDRLLELADRDRVFRAGIDVALGRPHRDTGDGHAFDQGEGVAFHQHPVGEGGAVALVGIADDVFLRTGGVMHRLPLDAGGEARAAPAAQARIGDFLHDLGGRHRQRAFQAFQPVMQFVIMQRQRVDDAATREGQARLAHHPRQFLGQAKRLGMAFQPVEQRGHVFGLHRAKGQAAIVGADFDQRFQPDHPARAVAYDGDIDAALGGFGGDRVGNVIGTQGDGGGIKGDPDLHQRAPSRILSSFAASARPTSLPLTIAAGPQAHRPRQNTGSSVIAPSAVVSCQSMPSFSRARSASASAPTDWHASARHSFSTVRPAGFSRKSW
eukprot:m.23134 g.23134  ORF g.23134 m.23134 type:complete len:587 (+) comp9442_c0_seq1:1952-3712(+)